MKVKLYQCGGEKSRSGVPLGIGYLLTNCKVPGVSLQFVEDPKELFTDNDMIGLSANAQGLKEAVGILGKAKVPVVIGGQGTLWPGLTDYPFTHIVVGEGERVFKKILKGEEDRKVIVAENIPVLDSILPPERGKCGKLVPIMTSRGCPFRCRYCSSQAFWKKVRYHSAERVIEEVAAIIKTYPKCKRVYFLDDLMTTNKTRLRRLRDLWLKRGYQKHFKVWTFVRADTFNEETARILKQLRTERVRFGAESGSDRVLKLLGKTTTVADNHRAIRIGRKHGLTMTAAFMYDIPGETKADRKATKKFIKDTKITLEGWYRFTPFPGCAMWDGTSPIDNRMRFRPKPGRKDFGE